MKLTHLFETVDHRQLLRDAAQELGLANPHFYDIDDDTSNAADVQAGIDLFQVHLDTDGSAQINSRMRSIEAMAIDSKATPDGIEALEALDGTSFEMLPHVHAFYDAWKVIRANANKVRDSANTVYKTYFLLAAMNGAVTAPMSSKHTADEVRYRAAISKACLKKLGITPKAI